MRYLVSASMLIGIVLTATPATAAPKGMPHAITEDACVVGVSKCVWDARHRGNGHGRSYILTRRGDDFSVRYVTHKRAHRLAKAWCARRDVTC